MKTGRGPKSATSATSIKQTERRAEVLRLRLDGHTLQAIGDRLGIRADSVHDIITRALRDMTKEPAGQLLDLELARLDSLYAEAMNVLRSFTPLLHNGKIVQIPVIDRNGEVVKDPDTGLPRTCIAEDKAARLASIAAAVRVMERRAKLTGLDAPSRFQQDVKLTTDEKPARNLGKLDSNEMQLLSVLLEKLDDPNTPAPDERRNVRDEVREKLTPFEIGILQEIFRKLDVQYIAADTVRGLYSTPSLPTP
jgi:DNA-binding CsgD family transcriptional regulator